MTKSKRGNFRKIPNPGRPPWRAQKEQVARNWAQSVAAGPVQEANTLSKCKIEPYAMKCNLIGRKEGGGGREGVVVVSKINPLPYK